MRPAGHGSGRGRSGVARARLRGPTRVPHRPWWWPGPAPAAMGLLRLLVLALLASQPEVVGGAETVGNSSEGKVGSASLLQPTVAFAFLARSKSILESVHLAEEVVSSEPAGMDQCPFLQKETPIAKEALLSTPNLGWANGKR